jgi:hypothetical protein
MTIESKPHRDAPRWRYVALAAAIFVVAALLLAGLWQLPRMFPGALGTSATPAHTGALSATVTATPPASLSLTTAPVITQPVITELSAEVDDGAQTITFHLAAQVPPERGVDEVLLWYDTEGGHQVRRFDGSARDSVVLNYRLNAAADGLTRTLTTTNELDYWWLVRDTAGDSVRAGATAILGPTLLAQVVAPTPVPPPIDFTWSVSESQHFQFHYMPGTAAERDLSQLSTLAEASLRDIDAELGMNFDGRMSIYFVPRVFWQGGATYGDKVQLISYLDRNYTGVQTWSYFTHEGTHALAQDLIQPKEEGQGGPDGVLIEGLAVWASGGHYRPEPIDAWAAVVAGSDRFIPLAELRAGPFYDFQHEISYLEAGSFVKFLIEQYGLDRFKELYGQATGDASHDDALVHLLYDRGYAELEDEWLAYLQELEPTTEQAETWWLTVRTFDLMRRYETELDPDARYLPPKPPTEWTSDTLKIFMGRADKPTNVVLETVLITTQKLLFDGDRSTASGPDLQGAAALLDDVEAALDAGGALTRPSLLARREILDLLAVQDRAVLHADPAAYRATLDPHYAAASRGDVQQLLQRPFVEYRQEMVSLDLAPDGRSAQGTVLLHARVFEGDSVEDSHLFAVTLVQSAEGWRLSSRTPTEPVLELPPPVGRIAYWTPGIGYALPALAWPAWAGIPCPQGE